MRHLLSACLLAGAAGAAEPAAAFPGHDRLPVAFWAHYMPQIPAGHLHCHPHVEGNGDAWPFLTQAGSQQEQAERQIEAALEAGIDGFQMLTVAGPDMYRAAAAVRARSGRTFLVAPEWCGMGADAEAAARTIADFAAAHRDDPHVPRVGGRQLHFAYGQAGPWADAAGMAAVRAAAQARGVEVMLVPTSYWFPAQAIGRGDLLRRPLPAFAPVAPGAPGWLESLPWDGATEFLGARADLAAQLPARLAPIADRFLFIPAAKVGYDSSNRPAQAIRMHASGVASLRDHLRTWTGLGCRQLTVVTWNDAHETLLMPSSRSPWGLSGLVRWYRGLAEAGRSTAERPSTVLSYQPEVMLGDQLALQLLVLPERGAVPADYIASVRFEDPDGAEVATLGAVARIADDRHDDLAEARLDTTALAGRATVLSPVATVRRVDPGSGAVEILHRDLRLPPVRLRANHIRFPAPYSIALDRVAADAALAVEAPAQAASGSLLPVRIAVRAGGPLRQVHLADGVVSTGPAHADDTEAGIGAGRVRAFVRLGTDADGDAVLAAADGGVDQAYSTDGVLARALTTGGPALRFPARAADRHVAFRTLRVTAAPDAVLRLSLGPASAPAVVEATLAGLAAAPVRRQVAAGGRTIAVLLQASADATDANLDQPQPATADLRRWLPLAREGEAVRVLHAWALTADGRIAWSRPVVVAALPAETGGVVDDPRRPVELPVVRSGGAADDFVDDSSPAARNPFAAADVVRLRVPAGEIAYARLDADEGAGVDLDDGAASHQFGRAWIEAAQPNPGHARGPRPAEGAWRWLADGWRGGALRLDPGACLRLRSKSWPAGAFTLGLRLRADPAAGTRTILADGGRYQGLDTQPVALRLRADGRVEASRRLRATGAEVVADRPLGDGWTHIALVYDLAGLRLYLDGRPAGAAPLAPTYQRTHAGPTIGWAPGDAAGAGLAGAIDQVELIGTALDDAAVAELHRRGHWRSR